MLYECGIEVEIGDVVAQLWLKPEDPDYLGTVCKIFSTIIRVRDNNSLHLEGPIHTISRLKFLRRKNDVRVGDLVWIDKYQNGAPAGEKVRVTSVGPSLFSVTYLYNGKNFSASQGHYLLARVDQEEVASASSVHCSCGGPVTKTGIGTLVIFVCSICKKEK